MQLTHETMRGVYAWFRECYPNEGCGLIDGDGRWVPVANVAPRPATSFLMAPGVAQAHGARAILHSHPNDWRCPSRTDMEASASIATNPPSPLLSARNTRVTYLTDTMVVRVQKKMDRMP